MKAHVLFAIAAGLSLTWNVVTSLRLHDFLKKRGAHASFLWLRVMAPIYAFRYKRLTEAERGRPGPLFYHWVVSINLVLVFGIAALAAAHRGGFIS